MRPSIPLLALAVGLSLIAGIPSLDAATSKGEWLQWRGPQRDGSVTGAPWPTDLREPRLSQRWRTVLGPSYSSPIVANDRVFTTETRDEKMEVVSALDRATGKVLWQSSWPGAMKVPFFAGANGSWIRSTPAFDGKNLYVAGMRDVLVCLDGASGSVRWRVDFVERFKSPLPDFGCVSSPLLDGDAVYLQAAGGVVKLNKKTGETLWRGWVDGGGMMGSAFSSPVIRALAGKRQLIVQAREKLGGMDLATGALLWETPIPAFRGMNILTPTVFENGVFTSSYGGRALFLDVKQEGSAWSAARRWDNNAQGYMCSPVVIDGKAYMHLRSQRFACLDLRTGKELWTSSQSFGKYMSLVAQGDRILALDERGTLFLIRANPEKLEILSERKVAERDTWAHLSVAGSEPFIRELNALTAFNWK